MHIPSSVLPIFPSKRMSETMYNELELQSIFADIDFESDEMVIHHKGCPVYNFFWAATCFLRDFPQGIIRPEGVAESANIGVWNPRLDDTAYIITRHTYGKYTIKCVEEELCDVQAGEMFQMKKSFISKSGLRTLSFELKKYIKSVLENSGKKIVLEELEKNYVWRMCEPHDIEEALAWESALAKK